MSIINNMDLSLNQIIEKSDIINNELTQLDFSTDYIQIKSKLDELYDLLKNVNLVSLKLSNICNGKKYNNIKTQKYTIKPLDNNHNLISKEINETVPTNRKLTDDISINVKIVKDIGRVPDTHLYWVSNINQYVVCINGIIFRGNIGNIYNKSHIKNNKPTDQILICKYGNTCEKLLSSDICKFYHDPIDLLQLLKQKKITKKIFDGYKKLYRNFLNTSWIYNGPPLNNNKLMSRFGSRNMLKHEIDLININNINISDFRHQCMHDILVMMGISTSELLK